jgi:DNA-binding transcriptional ArsR family regulator
LYPILKNVFMLSRQNVVIMHSDDNSVSHNNYFVAENVENRIKPDLSHIKHLLWMVFAASRGGQNRMRIVFALKRSPLNAHQLTKNLDLNYRAIQHHLEVLEKNNLVSHIGEKYGTNYFLSTLIEVNMKTFDELVLNLSRAKHERKGVYSK